jgi:hypothetical protein
MREIAAQRFFHSVDPPRRVPLRGKIPKHFSIVWKNTPFFSTVWKTFFHTVENFPPPLQPSAFSLLSSP